MRYGREKVGGWVRLHAFRTTDQNDQASPAAVVGRVSCSLILACIE